ncbi:hypothetical protein [Methylobacterium frigidaeris]|uniref:Uncharacterized protein n=1 Tax=Methylobacterium frigidaeris TaxID=2038277 RepID=A0AA37M852_9HYPH|nr:hypothetical protein [Methylobacterium frigidaeris]GJD66488.1 hypothetical protein MPEAHAMD_6686 [Methylobacterium frigidaeris]
MITDNPDGYMQPGWRERFAAMQAEAQMAYDEFLRFDWAHRSIAGSCFADRLRVAWNAAPGGSAGLTLEEWVTRFGGVTRLTPYQVWASRMATAMGETARLIGPHEVVQVQS